MNENTNLQYYFFYFASFVVVMAGFKAASEIVIILLLAIFISSILSTFVNFLQNKHIPKIISYFIVLLTIFSITFLLIYMVNKSLANFSLNLPEYEQKIKTLAIKGVEFAHNYGFVINKEELLKLLNFNSVFKFTTDIIGNIGVVFSKVMLVFIGVAFILSESKIFEKKLKIILKDDKEKLKNFHLFSSNLQKYFTVKTFTSFLTGFFIFFALIIFEIDYPIIWAVIGFLFNFIPVIGSIVAAVPAVLLALISGNFEATIWLILVYMVINISVSNIIEPKLMGKELGLSPMIIFFSLIFWGWILGIVGMFLAVPITMTLKIAFESTQSSRWIGIFMSSLGKSK